MANLICSRTSLFPTVRWLVGTVEQPKIFVRAFTQLGVVRAGRPPFMDSKKKLFFRRSVKSGSNWIGSHLDAYNIVIESQTKQEFFGTDELPVPTTPFIAGFLTTKDRRDATDSGTRRLLHYLDLAHNPKAGQEAAVNNFARKLLECLGYDIGNTIIFFQRAIPLVVCGKNHMMQIDLCVMNNDEILLLVQEDKSIFMDPQAQVISKAIAAFGINVYMRKNHHLPPINSMTFPAIIMDKSIPTFYKITVTEELASAVLLGIYPDTQTQVLKYIPVLPRQYSLGMTHLDNRQVILACLVAFKQFMIN
ncbi:hypothetical protein HD554DRAFT_2186396 [Boletus coccyginus]|nr:hypothetical protein HD554DRAFT_2186396 [Boletus coccyginus]